MVGVNDVEKTNITLDFTGAAFCIEGAWNQILEESKDKEKQGKKPYFTVKLIWVNDVNVNDEKITLDFVLKRENLYVVGFEKEAGNYLLCKDEDVSYNMYDKMDKRIKCLSIKMIANDMMLLKNSIANGQDAKSILAESKTYIAFVHMAFFISEAARFEFVRAAVKRISGYLNENEIKTIFQNSDKSDYYYACRYKYKSLLSDYGKIVTSANNGEKKNLHMEMLSIESCRNYYFALEHQNKESDEDLYLIGLLPERK